MTEQHCRLVNNFIRWGSSSDKLNAALLLGSQARGDNKADENSDADIVMFVDDPDYFLVSDEWLHNIGAFHIAFVEDSLDGSKERRVLFDGALDMDFIVRSTGTIDNIATDEIVSILSNGYQILVDKIGIQEKMASLAIRKKAFSIPTEQDFNNLVNDFWYHCVWTVKKLKRGELWTAKFCLDSYMKWKLLSIAELYMRVKRGVDYNTWYSGRFLEEWAEQWIREALSFCFAHYDVKDIQAALLSTMELFRSLAVETAGKLGYSYPEKADAYASSWVNQTL